LRASSLAPSAAVILSDFGADVIKVEPPKGELWRIGQKIRRSHIGRALSLSIGNRNSAASHSTLNRRKQGKILEQMVKWADVSRQHSTPARKKLGLEYEDVAKMGIRV